MNTESKYCGDVMKEDSDKALVMTKKSDDDFYNSTKRQIYDSVDVEGMQQTSTAKLPVFFLNFQKRPCKPSVNETTNNTENTSN